MAFKVLGPVFMVILAVGVVPLTARGLTNLLLYICIGGILVLMSDFRILSTKHLVYTFLA